MSRLSTATAHSTPDTLRELYRAAVEAADPGRAVRAALAQHALPAQPLWLLALGKAADRMAAAAVATLAERGRAPTGGLIVGAAEAPSPHPALRQLAGDHPEPGVRSAAAAAALGEVAARVRPEDTVWVLLSGGTTSLIGAPDDGLDPGELTALYALLLGSGLDIGAMNRIRKRFTRWGGGRLARALAPAATRVLVVSDVIGDDLAAIGSGPCVPDPTTAAEIRSLLESAHLWAATPPGLKARVEQMLRGEAPETPKPGDPAFARVHISVVASNALALEAAAKRAAELGLAPEVVDTPLAGEARTAGASVAAILLDNRRAAGPQPDRRGCLILGGETTVTIPAGCTGIGGRSQELALAAAETLAGAPAGVTLMAAGTDGRDGPTDAAGGIVDGSTWEAIRTARRDPAADLAGHDAYAALDSVGALLKPGMTGTNVMDVVIGCW